MDPTCQILFFYDLSMQLIIELLLTFDRSIKPPTTFFN